MQLKYFKSNFNIVAIPLIIIAVLLVTVSKQQYTIAREDLIQTAVSKNLGFSHFRTLVDNGKGERAFSIYHKIIGIISKVPEVIEYKLFNKTEFERLDIDIGFLKYSTLLKDRERAIKDQILTNPTKVNSIVRFMGEKYKAKVRLKGDLHHHWDSKIRMSLRIELKNSKNILGFSNFSIQKPRERKHPYDYAFQSMVRDTGNLASVHKFAHVFVNGEDWGIMDLEEHMSKEFVEKQRKKDTILFRFSNEDKWLYALKSKNPYSGYRLSDSNLYLRVYDSKRLKDEQNRKIYTYISNKTLTNDIKLYDVNAFSNALITTLAWNNTHTIADSNSRYYFNPYTLKIEPITADQGRWWINDGNGHLELNDKYLKILSSKSFKDRLPENLKKVSKIVFNVDDYFAFNDTLFPVDIKKDTSFVKTHMAKIMDNQEEYLIYPIKQSDLDVRMNQGMVRQVTGELLSVSSKERPSAEQAFEFPEHLHVRHYTDGILAIHNLLPDPVDVNDIYFNGKAISIDDEIVIPSYVTHPQPTLIKTQHTGYQDEKFLVSSEYQGFNRFSTNEKTLIAGDIHNPLTDDTTREFDFLIKTDDQKYEIKKGAWNVNSPIIIDGDLQIDSGVTLQFSKDAYLIVKGALSAIGKDTNPVTLTSISNSWKGIYVLNANKNSYLKYVNITNLEALQDGLLKLTGGVTFYKSNVEFDNVGIRNVFAEDALNIVESDFNLNSFTVEDVISDGLDSDFSKGHIVSSKFTNIGGDALDFSGSHVVIDKTDVFETKDKAISAGEKSALIIKDSNFVDVGVGVASKDGSSVTVSGTNISNYQLYGAMTYRKKDFYEMPNLTITNSTVSDGIKGPYIRQKGTSMVVDGVDIEEVKISVKKLYQTEVMSK